MSYAVLLYTVQVKSNFHILVITCVISRERNKSLVEFVRKCVKTLKLLLTCTVCIQLDYLLIPESVCIGKIFLNCDILCYLMLYVCIM